MHNAAHRTYERRVYYNASTDIYHNEIFYLDTLYRSFSSEQKREKNGERQKHDNDDMPEAVASKQKEYLVTII